MKPTIHGLFSTPIYISKLERKFTDKENKFISESKIKVNKNLGNTTTNNNYILNTKPFNNLKKELDEIVKDYFDKVISSSNNIESYITQSWLNYTETNQYHHKHAHPNSIVSGIIYINADKKNDKIKFFKDNHSIIKPEIKDYNIWNSETWWFEVETGEIILFPSSLEHMVETKQGTNTRISLSFNTFVKGKIGSKKQLTELIL
tara:strand:+ start:489 stop:1100 length:612 start_codon:yes stop_codon:yes gene_type:complete